MGHSMTRRTQQGQMSQPYAKTREREPLPSRCLLQQQAGWPHLTSSQGQLLHGTWQVRWGLGPLHLTQADPTVLNAGGLESIYTEAMED